MTNNITPTEIETVLPQDTHKAIQKMISISQKLVTLAETETQHLIQNDVLSFALLQQEKEKIASSYVQASEEFRARINDFQGLDKILLDRLEGLQNNLGDRTKSNNVIVDRMRTSAKKKTQETLITAQELAQIKPVDFEQDNNRDLAQNSQGSF